jgi:hypothetical protein
VDRCPAAIPYRVPNSWPLIKLAVKLAVNKIKLLI